MAERSHSSHCYNSVESLLYLNIASALVFCLIYSTFGDRLAHVAILVNNILGRNAVSSIGANIVTILSVALLTAALSVLSRTFQTSRIDRVLVTQVAVLVAIFAAPICWLQFSHYRWFGRFPLFAWPGWYPFETFIVALTAFSAVNNFRRLHILVASVVVLIHSTFWFCRYWNDLINHFYVFVPLVGFCTAIVAFSSVWVIRGRVPHH